MATRKAPSNHGDENSRKRRRVEGVSRAVSFDNINRDCLVHILSFLPAEDMNSFAICSRVCREARSHDSLDQTRTGTIIWRDRTTAQSFYHIIALSGWNNMFRGNRTFLRVKGVAMLRPASIGISAQEQRDARLAEVTSLDISCVGPRDDMQTRSDDILYHTLHLLRILPNLQSLDLSYVGIDDESNAGTMIRRICPNLTRLAWKGSNGSLVLTGEPFMFLNLTELYLDDSWFNLFSVPFRSMDSRDYEVEPSISGGTNSLYMWMYCRRLERLSIKGATWRDLPWENPTPISQEMLIKMVRNHSALRWLRSDLTEENVAMLQQERPEITFVSD